MRTCLTDKSKVYNGNDIPVYMYVVKFSFLWTEFEKKKLRTEFYFY